MLYCLLQALIPMENLGCLPCHLEVVADQGAAAQGHVPKNSSVLNTTEMSSEALKF